MPEIDRAPPLHLRESEMTTRLLAFDWASTPLGPMSAWPPCLRVAVGICLNSRFPMRISWGDDFHLIYNDGYAPILGARHPAALGRPAREIWPEVWHIAGPQMDAVYRAGEATWNERVPMTFERNGYPETVWLTYSYSPIPDDAGGIGGVFVAVTEDTPHVLAERERDRLAAQKQLALDSGSMGWWRIDPAAGTVYWDERFKQIFDVDDDEYDLAGIVRLRLHPVDQERVTRALAAALDPADPKPYSLEYRILARDGAERWIQANGSAAFAGEGAERRAVDFVGTIADITERKAAEHALLEGAERLRLAGSAAGVGYWVWDLGTDLVSLDATCAALFGVDPAPTLALVDVLTAIHAEDREGVRDGLAHALTGSASFDVEFRVVRAGGETRWLAGRGDVTRDARGAPVRMSGINLDVTEARRAAEENRRSLARLRAVVDNMVEGVVVATPSGDTIEWNAAALALHGYTSLEDARRNLTDLDDVFVLYDLAGRQIPVEDWPLSRVLRGESVINHEVRLTRPAAGLDRYFVYGGSPVYDADGTLILGVLTQHDVTQRRRVEQDLATSEARLRHLANAMPLIVWTALADGTVDYFNERWFDYTGNTVTDDHYEWGDVIHPDDRQRTYDTWNAAVRTGSHYQIEYRLRDANGGYRWHLGRASPDRDARGAVVRWFGNCVDVHEQKEAAGRREELLAMERAARVEAERVGRMKDEFLATLSHELRTPLNAILGWAQLIGRGRVKGEDIGKGLSVIERNARAQGQLIEDMLDMSRIAAGKVQLHVEQLTLGDIVDAALQTVRPAAEAKGITLHRDVEGATVVGDPHRLQQVVWNLLTNAVKFTPQGGRVTVTQVVAGDDVELRVTDTGRGISADFLPHVFERFRQAQAGTTREHGGLGLGLAIVKHLVEAHGGTVAVTSDGLGQGATFTVRLPGAQRRLASQAAEEVHGPLPQLTGLRVLVVDDEPDARDLIRRILGEQGAEVTVAGSALEALGLLRSEAFALVISDIGMPEHDGFDLIRQLRTMEPVASRALPAIALTAFARPEDHAHALAAGYQSHLTKPVDAAALHAIVAQLACGGATP